MKYYLLLVLFVCNFSYSAAAEKYYVIFVKGKIVVEKSKKAIKVGDMLTDDDKVLFTDKNAKLSCIHPTKGRFDISPGPKKNNSTEVYTILKSNLVPSVTNYHLSTRSLLTDGYDPRSYFGSPETQGRILIIENKPFLVKPSYKMDDSNFFFVQFEQDGKAVTHKISQAGQNLIFSRANFSSKSGSLIEKVSLCYQSNESGQPRSSVIAEFHPVLASLAEIEAEVALIKNISVHKDKKKLKSEIVNHLFGNYGKIGEDFFSGI